MLESTEVVERVEGRESIANSESEPEKWERIEVAERVIDGERTSIIERAERTKHIMLAERAD